MVNKHTLISTFHGYMKIHEHMDIIMCIQNKTFTVRKSNWVDDLHIILSKMIIWGGIIPGINRITITLSLFFLPIEISTNSTTNDCDNNKNN